MFDGTLNDFFSYIRQNEKKIICFGTGKMAEEALGYSEIQTALICMVDNDKEKVNKDITILNKSYKVIAVESLEQYVDESTIILIVSGYYKQIKEQLSQIACLNGVEICSYPQICVSCSVESDEFFEKRILSECLKEYESVLQQFGTAVEDRNRLLKEKKSFILGESTQERPLVIPRIMIMPTTRCNMRCKGCSSLLPYFKNPSDVDIEQILHDLELFFEAVDECIRITVGGEPFLYPNIKIILEYLLKQEKVHGILLVTNSTILPNGEILSLLKNHKILVEVSDYGHLEKMGRLITVLEENDVCFKVLTEQVWTDMGGIECRHRSKEELRFSYMNCEQSRIIKGMHNGRFHTCARSARLLALGAYESEHDYFDLNEKESIESIRKKIIEMYYTDYADSCNYCDLGTLPNRLIEAGVQMNDRMKKSEYTIVKRDEYEQLKKRAILSER